MANHRRQGVANVDVQHADVAHSTTIINPHQSVVQQLYPSDPDPDPTTRKRRRPTTTTTACAPLPPQVTPASLDYVVDLDIPRHPLKRIRVKGPTLKAHLQQERLQSRPCHVPEAHAVAPTSTMHIPSVEQQAFFASNEVAAHPPPPIPPSHPPLSTEYITPSPPSLSVASSCTPLSIGATPVDVALSVVPPQVASAPDLQQSSHDLQNGQKDEILADVGRTQDGRNRRHGQKDEGLEEERDAAAVGCRGCSRHHHPTIPEMAPYKTQLLDTVSDEDLICGLGDLLTQLCEKNEQEGRCPSLEKLTMNERMFFSKHKQPFSLETYLRCIVEHVSSRPVLVTALVYVDRLYNWNPHLALSEMNVHRILITAVVLASKFLEDEPYAQEYYQDAGGVPSTDELNRLESCFLKQIDWRLFVSGQLYAEYYDAVLARLDALHCLPFRL